MTQINLPPAIPGRFTAYVAENIELTQYLIANRELPRLNLVTR